MGGGHSKFDQNNWFKANGKLTCPSDTIDGATPTSQYCVYWITKRPGRTKYVVNQRDFDVVDGERNLKYSTSAVPGTLAYFDVLGPGLEDYKLRVTADLARRHWTVYRYGTPTFPGQLHDHDATLQLTQEHSTDGIRRFPSGHAPKLYKVCGITVSWSRYAAVAVMFGPPPASAIHGSLTPTTTTSASDHTPRSASHAATTATKEEDAEEDDDGEGVEFHGQDIPQAPTDELEKMEHEDTEKGFKEGTNEVPTKKEPEAPHVAETNPDSITPTASNTSPSRERLSSTGSSALAKESESTATATTSTPMATTSPPSILPNKSLDMFLEMENSNRGSSNRRRNDTTDSGSVTSTGSKSTKGSMKNSLHTVLAASSSLRATQQLPSWLFSKAKKASHIATSSATSTTTATNTTTSYLTSHNPLEGVLQMDRPLLQCQEIFTHLIGTHQTMLISKEQVVQMLKDDAAKEREAKQNHKHARGFDHEESVEVRLEDAEEMFTGKPHQSEEVAADVSTTEVTESPVADADGDSPKEAAGTTLTDTPVTSEGATDRVMDPTAPTDPTPALAEEPLPGTDEDEEQPLVGYWIWENSLYTHKMKMHLAKNSDLALHVVLAVIVNQVRYERNAIALTI